MATHEPTLRAQWGIGAAGNEWQLAFFGLFYFYKSFISSQDNAVCNFQPSCSVYAVHAVKKKGALVGILASFDRLTRCTGLNNKDYNRRNDNLLLEDPVW
ncbi:MAG: membrane protein insertion efficiency factor YidD [Bacteroidetes bacterium]|nr:membrane protein insertion efficiency factor YidD [Bacteroidota bacterium]